MAAAAVNSSGGVDRGSEHRQRQQQRERGQQMREPGQQRYGIIFDVWVHFLDLVTYSSIVHV